MARAIVTALVSTPQSLELAGFGQAPRQARSR
jgi:hypothetical protein